MKLLSAIVVAVLLAVAADLQAQDAVIGEVLGKPVHASQITGTDDAERAASLRENFIRPAIGDYLKSHAGEVELTEAESASIIASYNALRACMPELGLMEFKPPFDKLYAVMIGGNAKAQRFIYLNHGRGRVLFQQAGAEAFDATYRLILALEEEGKIRFDNPADRALALAYWTTQEHGSFLLPDPGTEEAFKIDALMTRCPAAG